MGRISGVPYPLQLELDLPAGAKLVKGYARQRLAPLAGPGGHAEHVWLVRTDAREVGVRVTSPATGSHATRVALP
ncbi:MAG: hypothetical protein ACE5JG_07400 [Planctomycetota bacterium]